MLSLQHTDLQRTLHELQSEIRSLSDQQVSVYAVLVKLMMKLQVQNFGQSLDMPTHVYRPAEPVRLVES